MKLDAEDLAKITELTLAHYEESAQFFEAGTRDHDVSQNIAALLRHIDGEPPYDILDLGCGPGRDLKTFAALGHRPVGLDGTPSFVAMARAASGREVWHQDFLRLQLPPPASTASSPTPSCSTSPPRNCPASCATCAPPSNRAASSSVPTRAAAIRKAGTAAATAPTTTWLAGAPCCKRQASKNSNTTTAPTACHANNNPGSPVCGEGRTDRTTRFTFRSPHLWNGPPLSISQQVAEDGYASITSAQRIRHPFKRLDANLGRPRGQDWQP